MTREPTDEPRRRKRGRIVTACIVTVTLCFVGGYVGAYCFGALDVTYDPADSSTMNPGRINRYYDWDSSVFIPLAWIEGSITGSEVWLYSFDPQGYRYTTFTQNKRRHHVE